MTRIHLVSGAAAAFMLAGSLSSTPASAGDRLSPGGAAALFHFGLNRAAEADRKLAAVGAALQEVLPSLQRLAGLADHLALEGEVRERVTGELSEFFNAFAGLLTQATAVLREGEEA